MRVMIIGGAGFVGSAIAHSLLEESEHEIIIVDNLVTGLIRPFFKSMRIEFVKDDLTSKSRIRKIFTNHKPEIVNFQAGVTELTRFNTSMPMRVERDLGGLVNLLECCKEFGCEKFIFASSGDDLYGNQEADTIPIATWAEPDPVSRNGSIKLASEALIKYYFNKETIPHVILRYTYVYGCNDHCKQNGAERKPYCLVCDALRFNSISMKGDGEQTRDFIHLADVVGANVMAMRKTSQGTYNIGTGVQTSYNDVVNKLEQIIGKKIKVKRLLENPSKILKTAVDNRGSQESRWAPIIDLDVGLQVVIQQHKERYDK